MFGTAMSSTHAHAVGQPDAATAAGDSPLLAEEAGGAGPARRRRRVLLAGGAGLAVALVAALLALAPGDPDRLRTDRPGAPVTAPATTATTAAATADTTTFAPLWPPADHPQYSEPVAAVQSFMREYLRATLAPLSPFRPGPGGTGEVDVYLVGEGGDVITQRVVATVSLRQVGDAWTVTGASSDDIVVSTPRSSEVVGAPVVVEGRARGYEGTIGVTVRDGDPSGRRLGEAVGIAGSMYDLMPFRFEIHPARQPSTAAGSLDFYTDSGCSECNTSFAVVPVRFAPPRALGDAARLRFDGIGPVVVGMTPEEAAAAAGTRVRVDSQLEPEAEALCAYAVLDGAPEGVSFIVTRRKPSDPWRITAVDVTEPTRIATAAGVRMGMTEGELSNIQSLQPGPPVVEPNPYLDGGHLVTVDDDGPGGLLLLFETDGTRVIGFRAGEENAVRLPEGCL